MITLITNTYPSDNDQRNAEMLECLNRNLNNPHIDLVFAVHETDMEFPEHRKLVPIRRQTRPTFTELFLIGYHLNPDGKNILCNSDIYFSELDMKMIKDMDITDSVIALTRHEDKAEGGIVFYFDKRYDSQDVWIWEGKLEVDADFPMGQAGCLHGDTILKYNRGNRNGSRPLKLNELYDRFNHLDNQWDNKLHTYIQSVDYEKGTVEYNRIVSIVESGIKPTIKITFHNKKSLILTTDHRIAMTDGTFIEAGKLSVGDKVLSVGNMKPVASGRKKKPKRTVVYIKRHPFAEKKKIRGHSYLRLRKHRLVVEANMNNMTYEEYISCLNDKKPHKLKYLDPKLEVHHIDEDTMNNELSNLQVLTKEEHARLHSKVENFKFQYFSESRIVSIKPYKESMTYDIQMESPLNNFCANGIFVHNCDNALAYKLAETGRTIVNPCKTIHCYHLHNTAGTSHNTKAVDKPYMFPFHCSYTDQKFKSVLHLSMGEGNFSKAFRKMGVDYKQIIYGNNQHTMHEFNNGLIAEAERMKPDMIFMQVHDYGIVDPKRLKELKQHTKCLINWTGDMSSHGIPAYYGDILEDVVTCYSNEDYLTIASRKGHRAFFFNHYDITQYEKYNIPKVFDVTFIGTKYNQFPLDGFRNGMVDFLCDNYYDTFCLCGNNWGNRKHRWVNREESNIVYNQSRIAINCSQVEAQRYTSDRLFHALASGTFTLCKYYPKAEHDLGKDGYSVRFFDTFEQMKQLIDYYIVHDKEREIIAERGSILVEEKFGDTNFKKVLNRIYQYQD